MWSSHTEHRQNHVRVPQTATHWPHVVASAVGHWLMTSWWYAHANAVHKAVQCSTGYFPHYVCRALSTHRRFGNSWVIEIASHKDKTCSTYSRIQHGATALLFNQPWLIRSCGDRPLVAWEQDAHVHNYNSEQAVNLKCWTMAKMCIYVLMIHTYK